MNRRIGLRATLSSVLALVLLSSAPVEAQQVGSVMGTIRDEAMQRPVTGVQVTVTGTRLMGVTNEQGTFLIHNVPAGMHELRATLLGYGPATVSVTVPAGGTATAEIRLAVSAIALDALVVTALGITQRERAIATSVQSVNAAELAQAREPNLVSALAGRAAGVDVRSTGTQGGSARIVIRGAGSLTGNNQPLFIVDGVPIDNSAPRITGFAGSVTTGSAGSVDYGNAAADINPNDIESLTILKGPNAAALYGSRAANGAIVITTKSGRSALGRAAGIVSVSQNVSFETPLRLPNYQNEYGQGLHREFWYVDGRGGGTQDGVDESWGPPLDGRLVCQFNSPRDAQGNCVATPWVASPDNVRDFFETGRSLTTNVAFAAATDRANARMSITNMDVNGMYPETRLRQLTTALNGGVTVMDRLGVRGTVQYIRSEGENRPGVGYLGTNPMQQFVWFGRQVDMNALRNYHPDPSAHGTVMGLNQHNIFNWNHQYFGNPFFMARENRNSDQRDRIIGNLSFSYELAPWLTAQLNSGTDWYEDFRERTYAHGNIGLGFALQGGLYQNQIYRQETNHNLLLSANRMLTPDVSLSTNVGGGRRISTGRFHYMGSNQLTVPGVYNFSNSAAAPWYDESLERKRIESVYGQAQFGYRDFWFVDVTGRNDWSSTLPAGNNSYFYPSVSTSLVVSEVVPALQGSPLSFAKLRASWARVGNDADPYQTMVTFAPGATWGGAPNFTVPGRLPNLNLMPEETNSIEVGTDLRFLRDRLAIDFTYYDAATTNQILPVQVSSASGYTSRMVNAGKLRNKGIELMATAVPVRTTRGFEWTVTANFARNRNMVEELTDGSDALVLGDYWSLLIQARQGHPYGAIFGRQYVRDSQGNIVVGANGRPLNLNTNPQGVLGNYNPDWSGSLSNGFRYGGLDFSFMLDTQRGGNLFSVTQMFGNYAGVLEETLEGRGYGGRDSLLIAGVRVVGGDTVTNTVRTTAQDYHRGMFGLHEAFVMDASFVKLREVRLGYMVPASFTQRLRLSSVHLSLVGRNLWLSTPIPHIDPETSFDASNVQGLEFGALPSARSIGFFFTVRP
jgi:TonB-linked SusC/RagA family outer membrane protein